jgi:diaminohydroxyphosphoribosylaminopyrimidine deaminase/5-amino-6-(5-phosphoribosylamino)uracil reductase
MNRLLNRKDPLALERLLRDLVEPARAFRFEVAPNPCVGAALLDAEGQELARGFHRRWGGPHAEIEAMLAAEQAGIERSRWHTLAVTLEPCSTQGKTPPCTEAILAAGIQRVVVGALDPDPRHRGKGLELLQKAGIEVQFEPSSAPLERIAPHFLRWNDYERIRRPRPWLIAKWAQTFTGQLSPPAEVGAGRWITSSQSLAEVQSLRAATDAIVTGVGTVKLDDPRLTLRGEAARQLPPGRGAPLRIVLDSELSTPPDAKLFKPTEAGELGGPVYLLCRAGANAARHRELSAVGARVHGLHPGPDGRVSLREAVEWMWRFNVRRALLEAGPKLTNAFIEAGLVDQVRLYTGAVRGGRGESLAPLLAAYEWQERMDRELGPDAVLEAFPGPRRG